LRLVQTKGTHVALATRFVRVRKQAGLLAAVFGLCLLAACHSLRSPPPTVQSAPATSSDSAAGTAVKPSRPAVKQYRLGPASSALVSQAKTQADSGNFGLAASTIERAMRIEPDSPLLWIELGRVRLAQGNASQADSMGRKALASATGDPKATASAWRLIADSLRALGRNPEAAEADQHAGAASAR
jgi:Flp pilus assembly protein TadD